MPIPVEDKESFTKAEVEELVRKQEDETGAGNEALTLKAELNDAERAYHKSLGEVEANEFLFATAEERATAVSKAEDSDPVVYKSDISGDEFRKSDDPRLVTMAKARDTDRKEAAKNAAIAKDANLTKRAEDTMANFPGEIAVHKAVLNAIDGIESEDVRKSAHEALVAKGTSLAPAFVEVGSTSGAGESTGGPMRKNGLDLTDNESQLENLAKARLEKHTDEDYLEAYTKVCLDNPGLMSTHKEA